MIFLEIHPYAFLSLACAACALAMGIIVYGKNPKNAANIIFMLLSVTTAIWGCVEFLYRQAPTAEQAMFWIRMGAPWALSAALVLHFTLAFIEAHRWLRRWPTYLFIYGPAVVFIALSLMPGQFSFTVTRQMWGWSFQHEPTMAYYAADVWVLLAGLLSLTLILWYQFNIQDASKRKRSLYVVLAFVIAVPVIFTSEIILPHFNIEFPHLTMLVYALVCALIGYGMWKHRLFALSPAAATESIINTMSDGLLLVGMDKKIKLINRATQQMLEYDPSELLEQPVDVVFSPKDSAETLFKRGTGFRGLIKTVIKGDVEASFISKSGRLIPVSLSGSLIRDAENDLLGIVCIARDISERRRARESLRLSEERYRLLVENAPLGIISIDTDGSVVDVNPKLLEILGSPSAEAARAINTLTFPPLVESGISADIKRCLSQPSQRISEYPYTANDNRRLFLRIHLVSRCDSAGAIVGVQGIVEDITETRATAEALRRAKEELEERVQERTAALSEANRKLTQEIEERMEAQRMLADEKEQLDVTLRSIADGVIAVDGGGKVVLMNGVAETLTGFSSREAAGKPLAEVFVTLNDAGETAAGVMTTAPHSSPAIERSKPVMLRARDGRERLISYSHAPIRGKGGGVRGAVLVFADITERHKLEEELFRTRRLESIGALAGGIAHDFNNILTGVITNLFVAKMQIDKTSEAYTLITETEKAAFKASSLTNQLLSFSNQGSPAKIVASMKELIEDSVGFFLSGSNVDYQLEMAEGLWKVEIDRGKIDQVLESVVRSAEARMPQGGTIAISAENIELGETSALPLAPGRYVKVSVQDEGGEMTQEDIERFFDPYFTRREGKGGLDLAAAYAIVKKHNGHISVSSGQGAGATVSIFLPRCEEKPAEHAGGGPRTSASDGRGKVLLMDDEEIVRTSGRALLQRLGYEVETCADGEQTLRLYSQAKNEGSPFDTVILDLTVAGGMGAKETMKRLLAIDPDAKGIVSSGYANDPVLSNYQDYGFRDVIAKPYKIEDLKDVIQSVIEND